MVPTKIEACDLFCGAGGSSTGLAKACLEAGIDLNLLAINHWQVAVDTHTANHPNAKHLCESVDNVDPRKVVPGGHLHVLIASPECTHHSIARGGHPINDQFRTSAWHIVRWAEALYIDSLLIENVKEFRDWGPIGANGRPLKSKKGQTYQAFLNALRSLGYAVEDRILNAADYGDPTTRERLFILARRGGKKIHWPEPTHFPADGGLFKKKPWRAAREIIDWNLPGQSIFTRKRPLSQSTMARILTGLRRFGGPQLEPFLVVLRNNADARSLNQPVPTLTAGGNHMGLCEPFILGQQSGATPRSVDQPVPTVATAGAIALVEPFILPQFSEHPPRSVDRPLGTLTTTSRGVGLVEPFLLNIDHQGGNGTPIRSVNRPVPTQTTKARTALVEPFLVTVNHGEEGEASHTRRTHSLDDPIPALTTKNGLAFIVPFFSERGGQAPRTHSVDEPLPTVTSHGAGALVEADSAAQPFITKYNGSQKDIAHSVDKPLDTVTTKDRFGLVMPEFNGQKLEIRFRMLQPHELAAAQGMQDYKFKGNRSEITKQIGNAVPVQTAKALCSVLLMEYSQKKGRRTKCQSVRLVG